MKKNYINRYFKAALIVGLVSVIGCKKNIDLKSSDTISTDNAITKAADVELATIGAYAALSYDNTIYANAIMSDEVRWALDNNTRNYGAEHKWQFDASAPGANDVTAAWVNLYNVIDRVNRVLAIIPTLPDAATVTRQKGELLALRAFCTLELVRNYATTYTAASLGVPILTQSSVLGTPVRNTFAEDITQIKADLVSAKALIPASFTTADNTRFSLLSISAIQARTALYEKNYADAITYATEVINAAPLATRAQFPGIWTDVAYNETVFSIKRTSTTSYTGILFRDANNDVFFSPSFKEIDLFDKVNDIRYASYIKQDLTLPAATKEQWLVVKYPGSGANKYNNVKVFRTAEMYLIRAEAYESTNVALGTADLNTLRAARITGYVPQVFVTATDLDNAIMTERMKELFCEGHRFFDLRRKALPVVRDDRDIVTGNAIPKTLAVTDRNYALPIPQAEILANKNMVQNPTYK